MRVHVLFLFCILAYHLVPLKADQPIMSEVPRWDGGYGIQIFEELRWSDDLRLGSDRQANALNQKYWKHYTHIEGVYTWHKWIRFTFKVPYVVQERTVDDGLGNAIKQKGQGFGDVKFALPLKKYFNKRRYSGNFGIVPQLRTFGDDKDAYAVSDGSTDPGLSLSYEYENALLKFHFDFTYWSEQDDRYKDDKSLDIGLGWNFHDRGNLALETEWVQDENKWWAIGPAFFWNFNDVILSRIEYKHALYEYRDKLSISRGNSLRVGVGVVF